ncbi:S-layer homology domain-containing protein [Domibacillus sp.]|uniref:S-layer homology domain-containing protein n=1 Tax=Domibacillus sp. TaxID=1969783 RepID=UPI0028121619|nr:S-layer homology domain-containing protein [Domibacillus sp.]
MSFKQKSYKRFMAASATATLVASAVTPAAAASFSDVTSPYKEAVNYLVSNGIADGFSDTEFGISGQIKRVDMAIMLAKALKLDTSAAPDAGFSDVPKRGQGSVNALKAAGLVNGKTAVSFGSDQMMTRGEMALILAKAYKLQGTAELKFTDVPKQYVQSVQALVAAGITTGKSATRYGTSLPITRGEFAIFLHRAVKLDQTPPETPTPEPALEVTSVSASSKTIVQVVFNKAIDSASASNFSIAGGSVSSVTLNSSKTVATLQVTGLADETSYTVSFNGIKVSGNEANLSSKTFTTPAAPVKTWNLRASASSTSLTADGKTSTTITYQVVDASTGAVDTGADNVAIDVSTTQGTLDSIRVIMQNGTASVKLTSPVSSTDVTGSVTAKIASAAGDYASLFGKTASVSVSFKKPDVVGTVPILASASATQADRVRLQFDRAISLSALVETNEKGELLYTYKTGTGWSEPVVKADIPSGTAAGDIRHVLRKGSLGEFNLKVNGKVIQGLKTVSGDPSALDVILDSKESVLTNNTQISVSAAPEDSDGKVVQSSTKFYLTDAKKPEVVSAQADGLTKVKVNFSEALDNASFTVDARFVEGADKDFTVEFGEFNPVTQEDNRHVATITVNKTFNDGFSGAINGYFTAGQHKVEVAGIQDFAGNRGVTQNAAFTVAKSTVKPTATVKAASPEQFHVTFNTEVAGVAKATLKLQKYDNTTKTYVDSDVDYTVEKIADKNEYKVELSNGWGSETYYTGKYRILIEKEAITNTSNGVPNAELSLDLSYYGSPLTREDKTAPSLQSITRKANSTNAYIFTMSEPVKLSGDESVIFKGKDQNGNVKEIEVAASDIKMVEDGTDTKIEVITDQLQNHVNDDSYSTSWSGIIYKVADDVGVIAETSVSRSFTVSKQVTNVDFKISRVDTELSETKDKVIITFTEGVVYTGGANDATVSSVYTLNGSALPEGTTFTVANGDGNLKNGFEQVVISMPVGTLASSNVITVKSGLASYDGSVLIGGNIKEFPKLPLN